jgi:hypothetical protein
MRKWAEGRAQRENVSGVYIGISKAPRALQVEPSGKAGRLLPKPELDRVVSTMRDAFKKNDFDGGLVAGLSEMRDRMVANVATSGVPVEGTAAPAPAGRSAQSGDPTATGAQPGRSGGGFNLGSLIIPILIGVVILFVLRRIFAGRGQQQHPGGFGRQQGYGNAPPPLPGQGPGGPGYDPRYGPQNQPGGGFGRGLAGGLLGGVAGSLLYDKLAGGGSAHAAPPPAGADPNAFGDTGSNASDAGMGDGGGGFFGDSGGGDGGGDFGGGDGGGGDF